MSDTKQLIERLRSLHMQCDGLSLYAVAADTIARLEADLQNTRAEAALGMAAARREGMEEAARIIDQKAEAYWAEWDAHADPSSQGSAAACEALLAAIRAAMEKP